MRETISNRRHKIQSRSSWFLALLLSLGSLQSSRAGSALDAFSDSLDSTSAVGDYFGDWFKRVDETQAVQPHWIAPVFLTTPLLTELYRYDQFFEHLNGTKASPAATLRTDSRISWGAVPLTR